MTKCKCGKMPHVVEIDIGYPEHHTLYHFACMCGESAPAGMMHVNGVSTVLGFASIDGAETAWDEHMERIKR